MKIERIELGDLALSGGMVDGPFGSDLKASEYVASGVPIIRLQNIKPGLFIQKEIRFVSENKAKELSRHYYQPGDLVIAKLGDPCGVAAVVPKSTSPGIIVADVVRFRGDPSRVDHSFISYFLNSPAGRRQIDAMAKGTTRQRCNLSDLKSIKIDLPPVEEQKRIAAILDKADSLRRKRQQAICLADDFLRAVFIDMFGDPVTNPKGWPVKKLAEVGTLDRGVSKHRPRNDPSLLGGKYPLIQTGEVSNCDGYIRSHTATYSDKGLAQSKLWPAGTLCITIAANIAKTGILMFDACFPDSVVGFSANNSATVEYVRFWLSFLQKALEENAPESAQKNINLAILRDLSVHLPPLGELQRFEQIVIANEKLRHASRDGLNNSGALTESLQNEFFG